MKLLCLRSASTTSTTPRRQAGLQLALPSGGRPSHVETRLPLTRALRVQAMLQVLRRRGRGWKLVANYEEQRLRASV